jgi:hypothetical protein
MTQKLSSGLRRPGLRRRAAAPKSYRNLQGSVFVADETYDALRSRFLPLQADELPRCVHVDAHR